MRIAIYCSSSDSIDPKYADLADSFGTTLGAAGHDVVYGGGAVGLMGRVAIAAQAAGAHVVGVIPSSMVEREVAWHGCDELVVTNNMRDRKDEMDKRADAFVILPGGFGTLEELFEVLTHRQLGYHSRPIVLVDVDGFWQPLVDLFEHLYETRFAKPALRATYAITTEIEEALVLCSAG